MNLLRTVNHLLPVAKEIRGVSGVPCTQLSPFLFVTTHISQVTPVSLLNTEPEIAPEHYQLKQNEEFFWFILLKIKNICEIL